MWFSVLIRIKSFRRPRKTGVLLVIPAKAGIHFGAFFRSIQPDRNAEARIAAGSCWRLDPGSPQCGVRDDVLTKVDPRFRGDDVNPDMAWIPAFAGMTSWQRRFRVAKTRHDVT
ncbi:MAG: hypothetical protein IT472_03740 [Thermomonas sp.]|uniref:hypothetical protein n=1 Tax=Thermomonas sp. TaxID=1971895 RepID=UPI00262E0BA4|nr:hypothetical protein [Thermomonas sp.]MCC7096277.1 hypothetical protein [Thermomonas sp.]